MRRRAEMATRVWKIRPPRTVEGVETVRWAPGPDAMALRRPLSEDVGCSQEDEDQDDARHERAARLLTVPPFQIAMPLRRRAASGSSSRAFTTSLFPRTPPVTPGAAAGIALP